MKKLIALILVLIAWNTFAQLTLVRETDKDLTPFQLSNGDWKLYSIDKLSNNSSIINSISIYNSDLSIYKNVKIPSIFPYDTAGYKVNNHGLGRVTKIEMDVEFEIKLSDKFFNSDDKIEFVVVFNSYYNKDQSILPKNVSIIMNEDGQEIQRFSNLNGETIKFTFWKYLNVRFSGAINSTKIYSIPGNLPCASSCNQKPASISPIDPSNAVNKLSIEGFPNPTSEKITLAYTLPKGSSYGTIRLYSQTGTLVKEFKVSDQFDHLELPVADYAAGTYFYELQVDGNSSGGKKMLVVH